MRKHSPRRSPGLATPPMLIMRGIRNDRLEIAERAAVEAFIGNWATEEHFNTLTDMQGVLVLAGSTSAARMWAARYARDDIGPVLTSIKERYLRTGKMGCTGDEIKVLRGFVSKYRDFWLRQPLALYEAACEALQRSYNQMAKEKAEQLKEAA